MLSATAVSAIPMAETRSLGGSSGLGLHASELEHLFDQVLQPSALLLDKAAVAPHLRSSGDGAVGEVLRRRTNDGERRAKLVRHSGDELHLSLAELRRPASGYRHQHDAQSQKEENPGAQSQVANAGRSHHGIEGARTMTGEDPPGTVLPTGIRRRRGRPIGTGPAVPAPPAVSREPPSGRERSRRRPRSGLRPRRCLARRRRRAPLRRRRRRRSRGLA